MFIIGAALATFASPHVDAQDNYEIQVYGADTVEPGHTMLELHSNFTFEGSKTVQDGLSPLITRCTKPLKLRTASLPGLKSAFIFSPRSVPVRELTGSAITFVRAFACRKAGTGPWALASQQKLDISAGSFRRTHGRRKSVPSSISSSANGISRLILRWNFPITVKMPAKPGLFAERNHRV